MVSISYGVVLISHRVVLINYAVVLISYGVVFISKDSFDWLFSCFNLVNAIFVFSDFKANTVLLCVH